MMDSARLDALLTAAGAYRWGTAAAEPVDEAAAALYLDWIAAGKHGEMGYLDRYHDVRRDPRLLLDGAVARSVIVAAFNYYHPATSRLPIARYARALDYHEVVRDRLRAVAEAITAETGASCRVTVDTAPLRERYMAVKAGLGFVGLNNLLIIPGAGSYFFLGEIITDLELPPSQPCTMSCGDCGRCVERCPGRALDGRGGIDARRCLSYLTIEYRGETMPVDSLPVLYGCDACQLACPHNAAPPVTELPEFQPSEAVLTLTRDDIAGMTQQEFSRIFRHSAVKRTKLSGLLRNLRYLVLT